VSERPAILFDAFGTLLSLDGVGAVCRELAASRGAGAEAGDAFAARWRSKQLEGFTHRSLMGRYAPFSVVTAEALEFALAERGWESALREPLLTAWATLEPAPGAADALAALGAWRRAVLTNGDRGMVASALASAGLAGSLDAVLSADDAGAAKPDPRVYRLGSDWAGQPAGRIWFVTANGWDAAGASAFGFRVCLVGPIERPHERYGPPPAARVATLAGLAEAVGAR
jgi:2-haloacid dehalogenase